MKVNFKSNGGGVVFKNLFHLSRLEKTCGQYNDSIVHILDHSVLGIALGRDGVAE